MRGEIGVSIGISPLGRGVPTNRRKNHVGWGIIRGMGNYLFKGAEKGGLLEGGIIRGMGDYYFEVQFCCHNLSFYRAYPDFHHVQA